MPPVPSPTSRGLGLLAGGGSLAALAWGFGQQDLLWPALFLVLLPVAGLGLALAGRPGIEVDRALSVGVVAAGEPVTVELEVVTRRPAPAGVVVAEDDPGAGLGAPHPLRVDASRPGARTRGVYEVRPSRRGRYRLDGFRFRFSDLMGLWVQTVAVAHPSDLAVTPPVVPLAPTSALAYGQSGDTPIPRTALTGPDDATVREYAPRDDVRRIHWPSTARTGTLMVRREEAAWDPSAWVLLDSRAAAHPERGGDRPSFEWLVSAAASIGLRLLEDDFTVTLVDAEGGERDVSAGSVGAVAAWLDPLIDAEPTGEADLREATARLARSGADHLVVTLLGRLDADTANLLVAATSSRQKRIALVADPDADPAAFRRGGEVLTGHGWDVHVAVPGAGLADVWGDVWGAAGAARMLRAAGGPT